MAFVVPTFNLLYRLYRLSTYNPATEQWDWNGDYTEYDDQEGALYVSKKTGLYLGNVPADLNGLGAQVLLVPAGTDIQDTYCGQGTIDIVEVPQDTGRFYLVTAVDDTAKGYINEYRVATLIKAGRHTPWLKNMADWPSPIP